ncbi:MAG: carboxymuconolactone decarboxylase family protein [Chloroflexota bacterium]|nr:carboxymuconolactone decarboxylase family protein [Chloroflexota bacterium]
MAQRIHLAAVLEREGKLLLLREAGEAGWSLPGGDLLPEHDDVDVGMAAILGGMGVTVEGIEEAFYETLFIPTAEGHMVYNVFATSAWEGEPAVADGVEVQWVEAGALADLPMDEHVRAGVLAAFGLAEPRDDSAAIMEALQREVRVEAEETGGGFASRREAGRDVLRTLSGGGDPDVRHAGLRANSPELADDVVDFALGEVWGTDRLDRRTRSLEVVAMLAALTGRPNQLRSHINGALNHGATPDEVVETLRMVAVYAGFPAALTAWPVMEEVFAERGVPRPERPS